MGCSNSVGVTKTAQVRCQQTGSNGLDSRQITQLRTYCIHFAKPSPASLVAAPKPSAIKAHNIFSSGELGGGLQQPEMLSGQVSGQRPRQTQGKTVVKLTSIDQPINQEPAESTPNRRKGAGSGAQANIQLTSRGQRNLYLSELAVPDHPKAGAFSMQELHTPTVVRGRNFSNHTDKLESPAIVDQADSLTSKVAFREAANCGELDSSKLHAGRGTPAEASRHYVKRATLLKTGQLPLWSPLNNGVQKKQSQNDPLPKTFKNSGGRPRLYSDTQLLVHSSNVQSRNSELELPELPASPERGQYRIPQLGDTSEKKFARSATKQPTQPKHRRKASEAADLLYKRPESQWNETPSSAPRSKVHFNTLGPVQTKLGVQESSPEEKSQNSEYLQPKRIEEFRPY